jgi:hypothetical protein
VRIVKASGLALVVALAMAAFGAPAASASWSDVQEQTKWVGVPTTSHALNLGGDNFSCSNASFSASAAAGAIFVSKPELGGCTNPYIPGSKINWNMNGCEFVLNYGANESDPGTLDINNCAGPIFWQISGSTGSCEYQIPMQSGISVLSYESSGSTKEGDLGLTINANLSGITYVKKGTLCQKPGEYKNGTYSGTWRADDGLRFRSSGGSLSGVALEPQQFVFGSGEYRPKLTCGGVSYGGSTGPAEPALNINPTYSECKMNVIGFNINTSVKMNGCAYRLNVHGGLSIGGFSCASSPITIKASNYIGKCEITIGPQFLGKVPLSNQFKAVKISPAISTIAHTATGELCISQGSFSDGTLKGDSSISAPGGLSIS